MDQLWTVLIIPVALSGVFLAIQYFLAPRRAKLVVVPRNYAPLKMEIEGEFADIELRYKGSPIEGGFGWISGFIFNEGPRDIHETIVSVPLSLNLPHGFVWREVACSDHDCRPSALLDGPTATFKWSMLRARERVRFSALIEAPTSAALTEFFDGLPKSLKASQRISDANSTVARFEWRQYAFGWSDVAFALVTLGLLTFFLLQSLEPSRRTFAAIYFAQTNGSSITSGHPYLVRARGANLCVSEVSLLRNPRCLAVMSIDEFARLDKTVRPYTMPLRDHLNSPFMWSILPLIVVAVVVLALLAFVRASTARYAEGGIIRLPSWMTKNTGD